MRDRMISSREIAECPHHRLDPGHYIPRHKTEECGGRHKGRKRLTKTELRLSRWLRALGIAKVLFEDEGYHTAYLEEIEAYIRKELMDEQETPHEGQ